VQFFITLVRYRSRIPLLYALVYGMGNFVLQGLNIFWYVFVDSFVIYCLLMCLLFGE
jgi:hypothetical protein